MKRVQMQTRIERLSKKYVQSALCLQNRIFNERLSKKYLEDLMCNPDYVYLVMVLNEEVIGLLYYLKNSWEAQLIDIAIDEKYRGFGYAKALLSNMIEQTVKAKIFEIFLEVRKSNVAAIGLYRKFGFKEIGTRREYYSNPCEDAILMKR